MTALKFWPRLACGLGLLIVPLRVQAADITGAGSSFVYPILSKWAEAYKKATGDSINYQPIGSGGGIKQIQSQTVDFGATDKPLTQDELDKIELVQFPVVNGAVVAVLNVPGIASGSVKMTGPLLADIYTGKVKSWNDKSITALNPGIKFPEMSITVVHRSDGSGTSFIWTNYLSKVSPAWKEKVGEGTAVNWPVGIGGKGNEGVAAYVKSVKGAIGYVEYAYAQQNSMNVAAMKNAAGQFVRPEMKTFAAAASHARWESAPAFNLILTDAPGAEAWPIAGSTFILLRKAPLNHEKTEKTLAFFRSVYTDASAEAARQLHYVPLTGNVVKLIEESWKQIKPQDGQLRL